MPKIPVTPVPVAPSPTIEAYSAPQDVYKRQTDSIAIGAKKQLEMLGKRIPEDVALAGIGHSRMSELVRPRLATAHYYYQSSGEEAARDLLEIIEQGVDRKKQLMLGFEVFSGESV